MGMSGVGELGTEKASPKDRAVRIDEATWFFKHQASGSHGLFSSKAIELGSLEGA